MYSFDKWWKLKFSLMGFIYRVVWVLKALWIFLSETIKFLRKLHRTNIFGMPRKFYHRLEYIAPSRGHISLNFNMPFKLILRRFEILMSEVRMLHFLKDWWKFIQIHQYYNYGFKRTFEKKISLKHLPTHEGSLSGPHVPSWQIREQSDGDVQLRGG